MSTKLDVTVNQGETTRITANYTQNGVVVDMTGYAARMQLRESYQEETPALDLNSAGGGITITPLLGKVDILLTDVQTLALKAPKTYVYDLVVTSPGGDKIRFLEGTITTTPGVTR